jgi:hypothetical protein
MSCILPPVLYKPNDYKKYKHNTSLSLYVLGNPCEEDKPFLCRSSPTCIALEQVCDTIPQCPDGFDESPALCNASKFNLT